MRRIAAAVALMALLAAGLVLAPAAADQPPRPFRLPQPLFFVEGMEGRDALSVAPRLGLNAVQIRLPVDATEILPEIRRDLARYPKAGLKIILQLPTNLGLKQRVDLADTAYWKQLKAYINAVVPALRDIPGLAAWQTDDYLEIAIHYSTPDLQAFLKRRYGSLDALNAAWGTNFDTILNVNREAARQADTQAPYGVGIASVDLADQQVYEFGQIMARWAAMIRHCDPSTPLMTGRISLYRSLASVPPSYDVVVPAIRPDVLEEDLETGNVQEVDMARRGGRFDVVPSLFVPLPPSQAWYHNAVTWWAMAAAAHGARGFALEDFTRLTTYTIARGGLPQPMDPAAVDDRLRTLGKQLAPVERPSVFSQRPRPNYAFLWTPYAGGLEAMGVPAYGYLRQWSQDEPSSLFYMFRRGCAYGTPDYLTPADVPAVDLDRYGAILAPEALSVPMPVAAALEDWVHSGGLLVADLGLGMYQGGDWLTQAPPISTMTGLSKFTKSDMRTGPWQTDRATTLLPGVPPGAVAEGLPVEKRGTASALERKPWPYQGLLTYCAPPPGVETIALADTAPTKNKHGRLVAGIFGYRDGAGGSIYASFRLWARWDPLDPLFAAFHEAACSRNATYRLAGGFWPGSTSLTPDYDGVTIVAREGGDIHLFALGARSALYDGAYCYTSAQASDVDMLVDAAGGGFYHLTRRAVAVRPYEGRCLSNIELSGPEALQIRLYGDRGLLVQSKKGLLVERPYPVEVEVDVGDGLYHVAPGSAHVVTVAEEGQPTLKRVVRANSDGHLVLTLRARNTRLTIEPASPS